MFLQVTALHIVQGPNEGVTRMLYYADAGPGPRTKLLAVDSDGDDWWSAPAWRWNVKGGWKPEPNAQLDIHCLGEFFLIPDSQVLDVQHEMLVTYERFHSK
jgi:hypothetical protein